MSQTRALLYDPRADYNVGDLVYAHHPVFGASMARVKDRIDAAGASKVEFDFSDPEFVSKWLAGRHTAFWVVNSGRGRYLAPRVYITFRNPSVVNEARSRMPVAQEVGSARRQGVYQRLILRTVKQGEQVTLETLKSAVRNSAFLTPADWRLRRSNRSKVVWLERLHAAIHNLVRVGMLTRIGRGVYQRGNTGGITS